MAKKSDKIVFEDVELKPQTIGKIYENKTNMGRVVFIFIVFGIIVYFINDISVFFNDLLGKKSATSIEEIASENKNKTKEKKEEDIFELSDSLVLVVEDLTITYFKYENNTLTFDAFNYTENDIDLSNKNYYLETYDENKELLESKKIDFGLISQKNKVSIELVINNAFKYIKIVLK